MRKSSRKTEILKSKKIAFNQKENLKINKSGNFKNQKTENLQI